MTILWRYVRKYNKTKKGFEINFPEVWNFNFFNLNMFIAIDQL